MSGFLHLAIYPGDKLEQAVRLFKQFTRTTLPVLANNEIMLGVVRLRDIAGITSLNDAVANYIATDFTAVQRLSAAAELYPACLENQVADNEIYVLDYEGKLVDIIDVPAFLKEQAARTEIISEDQFLKQILRTTSLARCILDGLNDGVVLVDRRSRILYANPAYGRILGIDYRKVINGFLSKIEPGAKIMNVIATGVPLADKPIEIKSLGVTVLASITPILFRGEVAAAVSVFSDITAVLTVAAELERTHLIKELLVQEVEDSRPLPPAFSGIIGKSKKLRRQLDMAAKVAPVDSPVLVLGESGTGKELLARAIHHSSARKDKPFISINCSAIPEHLLESELFGYDDGAFTGAKKGGKKGKLEQAEGGTLFLDEIGDMPLPMQTKLLRFLQEREFERVGGLEAIKVDIRIIAATNKDMTELVGNRLFREDLLYRLNVFTVYLPPLRDRKTDIINLLEYYKEHYERKFAKSVELSQDCLRFLLDYRWPGNIRELKNVVEHFVILAEKPLITVNDLPSYLKKPDIVSGLPQPSRQLPVKPLITHIRDLEKRSILDALEASNYNKTKAMQLLGVSRRTFYKKLKEMGI